MAPVTPTGVPSVVVAGDSWRWRIADQSVPGCQDGPTPDLRDYPHADGWALSYRVLGEDEPVDVTVEYQTTGDDKGYFLATVSTTVSDITAGAYRLIGRITGSGTYTGRVLTVSDTPLTVQANPATAAAGDFQSQASKDYDAITAVLEGRITADLESYQVAGRAVTKIPIADLWRMKAALSAQVRVERFGSSRQPIAIGFRRVGT